MSTGIERFNFLVDLMSRGSLSDQQKSGKAHDDDCSDTQTPSRISQGTSPRRERESRVSKASVSPRTLQAC